MPSTNAFDRVTDVDTQGRQVQGPAASAFLLNPTSADARNPAVLNGLTATTPNGLRNTSAALFGKLTWNATGRLQVAPGLRLNYDQKSGYHNSVATTGTGAVLTCSAAAQAASAVVRDQCSVLAPQRYDPRFHNWNLSGDLTVSYLLAPDIHSYATYARSYKSGGINLSGLPLDANKAPILSSAIVAPEKVNHYEFGLKTQFLRRRATVNLAAFWTDVSDYQATVTNGQLGVLRGYLANAEHVRTRGFEADGAFRAGERFNLYANGAYTDAKYVHFANAPCPPELSGGTTVPAGQTPSAPGTPGGLSPASCDISGQVLPGVSRRAFSYGAEYDLPGRLAGLDGQFYVGYDGSYRSRFSANPSPSAYTFVDGYALSSFRVGFKSGTRWNVWAWVRNAFNQDYYELLATQ